VGCPLAAGVFAKLVVDVWDAKPPRLNVPPIHNGTAEHNFYLHDYRLGLPPFFLAKELST